ncbi:UNVERIFIED_CONTAM: hypothetical protein Sangu_2649800 [Sesamum angustifolium]|uniref:Uncharacterized protein n=1 Tax=Sesamum angustifolium TaxID=2727405 RepID=A0AAW2J508_9LAMI
MGGNNNGPAIREHSMVHSDGPPEETDNPEKSRRHTRCSSHAPGGWNLGRHPHRAAGRAKARPPLLPDGRLTALHRLLLRPEERPREGRGATARRSATRGRVCSLLEHLDHELDLFLDKAGGAIEA